MGGGSLFLNDEDSDQNAHQQRHPAQHPPTQRLASSPPLGCGVFPENLGKAVLQTLRESFQFSVCVVTSLFIKQGGGRAGRNVGGLTEDTTY